MRKDMGLAASIIGIMIGMLRERYTDVQIRKMLRRKNIDDILKVLDEK